ncbi:hypothetical protein AC629_23710 [Bradyrhizobium sp. NAS80.1]|uniref:outer membrane protein n=1 Tax=Bradyrhizobium sp. NAS80.1 TaxID=1680159 RepID=UPI0009699322|nr:outer membrane beta-barrel protein [Bradyrhizobium sp. NAS80.1]OKO82586.1 hypothetical protein AC629_23710 [Bradyrhizobium sp. NAS80.1]
MQKHFLFAFAVAALSSAGSASVLAADQLPPVKAPVLPEWTWDGFYLGANAGYAWAHDPLQRQLFSGQSDSPTFGDINSRGALGGFYAGFNRQNGRWLSGLELDVSTGIRGSSTASGTGLAVGQAPGTETLSIIDKLDMLGSGRVRLGYLPRPDLLLYATGGLAWSSVRQSADDNSVFFRGGGQITHWEDSS